MDKIQKLIFFLETTLLTKFKLRTKIEYHKKMTDRESGHATEIKMVPSSNTITLVVNGTSVYEGEETGMLNEEHAELLTSILLMRSAYFLVIQQTAEDIAKETKLPSEFILEVMLQVLSFSSMRATEYLDSMLFGVTMQFSQPPYAIPVVLNRLKEETFLITAFSEYYLIVQDEEGAEPAAAPVDPGPPGASPQVDTDSDGTRVNPKDNA